MVLYARSHSMLAAAQAARRWDAYTWLVSTTSAAAQAAKRWDAYTWLVNTTLAAVQADRSH